MNTEQKNKMLIWLVAVLLILNLSTIATIIFHINSTEDDGIILSNTQTVQLNGRYFKDNLGFDGEQMDQFHVINDNFRSSAKDINNLLNQHRDSLYKELIKPKTDTIICNNLSAQIGKLHELLKIKTYKYYIDLKHICTKEQETVLQKIFEPVFESEKGIGCETGSKQQHRYGKKSNNIKNQ